MGRAYALRVGSAGAAALYVTGPNDTGFYNAPGYPGGPSDHAGSSLIDGTAITIQSDTTYNYYRNLGTAGEWGGIGSTGTPVHNVVFNGCEWSNNGYNTANVVIRADGPITFNYCTIRPYSFSDNTAAVGQLAGYQFAMVADGTQASPGTYNSFAKALTVDHCDIWGFSNASKIAGSTQTFPHVFTNNWVHNARTNDDGLDHTDGLGSPGGGTASYVTYTGNRIESNGDTNGLAYQYIPNTGSVSDWDHFTVRYNLFGGYGNCVAIVGGNISSQNGGTNITFEDNTFSTLLDCGLTPLYTTLTATGTGNSWRRNRWLVPPGAFWGTGGNSGKFWMPVSSNRDRGTGDDTPFVSSTDYTG